MKQSIVALLISFSLFIPATFGGDIISPKIQGAETSVPLGDIVILSIKSQKDMKYLKSLDIQWKIYDSAGVEKTRLKTWQDGTIIFGAGIKNTTFKAVANVAYNLAIPQKDDSIHELRIEYELVAYVQVGENQPEPGPGPSPEPKPIPIPEGHLGLTKMAYGWSKDLSPALLDMFIKNIDSAASTAPALSIENCLAGLKAENQTSLRELGIDTQDTLSFAKPFGDTIYQLYTERKINSGNDLKPALQAVVDGLKLRKTNG